jgi:hypothetical protein
MAQIDDDTPAGELARELAEDSCTAGASTYLELRRHLTKMHNRSGAVLAVIDAENAQFIGTRPSRWVRLLLPREHYDPSDDPRFAAVDEHVSR